MKINDLFHLGVLNITPNSFSDTERLIDETNLINRIQYFNQFKNIVLDIGFESTAPMNSPITLQEEKERFHYFLDVLKKSKIKFPSLVSIDSYKIENYHYFYQQIKKLAPKTKIIFNDVSGKVDDNLFDFLNKHKDAYYIYCFTEVFSRETIHTHMQLLKDNRRVVDDMEQSFFYIINKFKNFHLIDRLFLDPSFGFSKKLDENWMIIDNRDDWINKLIKMGLQNPVLIGLSKKSFIHKLIDSPNAKEDSELVHYEIISWFRETNAQHFFFRVHDPAILGPNLR